MVASCGWAGEKRQSRWCSKEQPAFQVPESDSDLYLSRLPQRIVELLAVLFMCVLRYLLP